MQAGINPTSVEYMDNSYVRGTADYLEFKGALVIMPSVPSLPMISCSRQYPVDFFFKRAPSSTISPVGVPTSTA